MSPLACCDACETKGDCVDDGCKLGKAVNRLHAVEQEIMRKALLRSVFVQSPWVSVNDRQPEKDGTYLVLKKGDVLAEATTTPFYKGDWIWGDGNIIRMTDPDMAVEWWMHIPALPSLFAAKSPQESK